MNATQFEALLVQLTRIANALEAGGQHTAPGVSAVAAVNPYASPNVPEGYDTVLGYFARTDPEALDLMVDPIADTQRDGFWLTHQAHRRDIQVVSVEAPEPLKQIGIDFINAYPIKLLEERLG